MIYSMVPLSREGIPHNVFSNQVTIDTTQTLYGEITKTLTLGTVDLNPNDEHPIYKSFEHIMSPNSEAVHIERYWYRDVYNRYLAFAVRYTPISDAPSKTYCYLDNLRAIYDRMKTKGGYISPEPYGLVQLTTLDESTAPGAISLSDSILYSISEGNWPGVFNYIEHYPTAEAAIKAHALQISHAMDSTHESLKQADRNIALADALIRSISAYLPRHDDLGAKILMEGGLSVDQLAQYVTRKSPYMSHRLDIVNQHDPRTIFPKDSAGKILGLQHIETPCREDPILEEIIAGVYNLRLTELSITGHLSDEDKLYFHPVTIDKLDDAYRFTGLEIAMSLESIAALRIMTEVMEYLRLIGFIPERGQKLTFERTCMDEVIFSYREPDDTLIIVLYLDLVMGMLYPPNLVYTLSDTATTFDQG